MERISLRDINLRLKDNNHKEEDLDAVNQMLYEATSQEDEKPVRAQAPLKKYTWIRDEKGDFFTYVSDLNDKAKNGYPRNQCPRCRGLFHKFDLQKNMIACYLYRCPDCGVMLTIYKK